MLGGNDDGQLGIPGVHNGPQLVPLANVRSVYAGTHHTCATTTTDELYCWGRNANHQVGNASVADLSVDHPVLVEALPTGGAAMAVALERVMNFGGSRLHCRASGS